MFKLIKLYFFNTLKLNYLRIGDKKGKTWGFLALIVFAAVSCLFAAGMYAYMIASAGLAPLILPIFMVASSLVTLISVLFSSKNILFGFKDYDMQASLPVKHSSIVASRLFIMYFYELLITMVILIPAAVVYAWYVQVQALFYIYFILTLLLIPLLPLTLGAILGAVIAALSSKVRKSNIVQVILMTAVTLAFMAFSMTASSGSLSSDIISNIYDTVSRRWPPVIMYDKALGGNVLSLVLFIFLSLIVFVIFSWLTGRLYNKINSAVTAVFTKGNYKVKAL
jgi:ABC-2 type transport system permease protein